MFYSLCYSVLLDSGSRYEANYTKGISHFLEKLAFGVSKELCSSSGQLLLFSFVSSFKKTWKLKEVIKKTLKSEKIFKYILSLIIIG